MNHPLVRVLFLGLLAVGLVAAPAEAQDVIKLGNLVDGPFSISGGTFDGAPSASSPIPGTQRNIVAFVRGLNAGRDVVLAAIDGTTVVQERNLSKAVNPSDTVEQLEPSVDCDGEHFVVAYSDFDSTFGFHNACASDVVHAIARLLGARRRTARTNADDTGAAGGARG